MRFYRVLLLAVSLLALFPPNGIAVETFTVSQHEDTAFLPYRSSLIREISAKRDARRTNAVLQVYRPRYSESEKSYYFGLNMPRAWEDQTFNIDVLSFPPAKLELQAAVRGTPYNWTFCHDTASGFEAVVVSGFHRDTAWVVQFDPRTAEYQRLFLQTGEDSTGNGRWEPEMRMPYIGDYDYDGVVEAFVHVKPIREGGVRTLFCVELGTMEIEWSLPVALGFYPERNFYRLPDSLNPGVIFVARGSRQGHVDVNYDELFGYLSVVDSSGRVRFNRVVQSSPVTPNLLANRDRTRFYMTHEFEPVEPALVDSLREAAFQGTLSDETARISVVDTSGVVLYSRVVEFEAARIWLLPFGDNPEPRLFAYHADRRLRVYDSTLRLLAVSEPLASRLGEFYGSVDLEGHANALLFSDGIYSRGFEQLADFATPSVPMPLAYDSSGRLRELLLSSGYMSQLLAIERRDWWDLFAILYFRYKIYIMVMLTGLLVGLLVMNFYRSRTRKNLLLIQEQKAQLEEAQRSLREAQARLVEQEKYKQARDIAGGFAHEIRNALSPARNVLSRLMSADSGASGDDQFQRFGSLMDRSVVRAIDLTQRITEYSHLEGLREVEPVNLANVITSAVEGQRHVLNDRSITVNCSDTCSVLVRGNNAQYQMVFNNLISNAVDALEGVEAPVLDVVCSEEAGRVVVEVSDNGCGIAEEDLSRVFDFFFSTKPETGSGVGLALVRKTLEVYGGTATVRSEVGKGTTFRLEFPKATD